MILLSVSIIDNYNKDKVVAYVRRSEYEHSWSDNPSSIVLRHCGLAIRFARAECDDYKSVTYKCTNKYMLGWLYDWDNDFLAVDIYQRI